MGTHLERLKANLQKFKKKTLKNGRHSSQEATNLQKILLPRRRTRQLARNEHRRVHRYDQLSTPTIPSTRSQEKARCSRYHGATKTSQDPPSRYHDLATDGRKHHR